MPGRYEPDRGDVIWLDLVPQAGHEQTGRRPVLVLSHRFYNQKAGFAIVCPITSKIKDYPFVVKIPDDLKVKGAILADQIKSLDWQVRKAEFLCKMPSRIVKDVIDKLRILVE